MATARLNGNTFFFACFDCGSHAFLIRGSCEWCEPELHRTHRERMEAGAKLDAAYFTETGKRPLEDWYAFEAWLERL